MGSDTTATLFTYQTILKEMDQLSKMAQSLGDLAVLHEFAFKEFGGLSILLFSLVRCICLSYKRAFFLEMGMRL